MFINVNFIAEGRWIQKTNTFENNFMLLIAVSSLVELVILRS